MHTQHGFARSYLPLIVAMLIAVALVWASVYAVASAADRWPDPLDPRAKPRPGDAELLWSGAEALMQHCPGLTRYKGDLIPRAADSWVTTAAPRDDMHERYGWRRFLIAVRHVEKKPVGIPANYDASGQLCAFAVGLSGRRPGIHILDAACASLCLDRQVPAASGPMFLPLKVSSSSPK